MRLFNVTTGGNRERYNVVPLEWVVQGVHIAPAISLEDVSDVVKGKTQLDALKKAQKKRIDFEGPVVAYVNKFGWGLT